MSEFAAAHIAYVLDEMYIQMCEACMFVWAYIAWCVRMHWLTVYMPRCIMNWIFFFNDPDVHETEIEKMIGVLKTHFNMKSDLKELLKWGNLKHSLQWVY